MTPEEEFLARVRAANTRTASIETPDADVKDFLARVRASNVDLPKSGLAASARLAPRVVEEAAPSLDMGAVKEARGAMREMSPEDRKVMLPKVQGAANRIQEAAKEGVTTAAMAKASGEPETAQRVYSAVKMGLRGLSPIPLSVWETAARTGLTAAHGLQWVLDQPKAQLVRRFTTPGRSVTAEPASDQEWMHALGREYPWMPTVRDWQAAGNPIGHAVGAATAAYGAIPALIHGEKSLGQIKDEAIDDYKSGAREVQNFALQAVTDPLNWFTFGGGSAGKVAGRQFVRAAEKSIGRTAAESAVPAIESAMGRMGGTPEAWRFVEDALTRTGVPAEDALRVFGPKGANLGKGGARLQLPFADFFGLGDKLGVDVAEATSRLGLPEHPFARAIGAAAEKVGARSPFDPDIGYTQQKLREARMLQRRLTEEGLDEYGDAVKTAGRGGITPEVQQDVIANVIDPPRPGKGTPMAMNPLPVPAQEWADRLDSLFGRMRGEATARGAELNFNTNAESGRYWPRVYRPKRSLLEETAAERVARESAPTKARWNNEGRPVGEGPDPDFQIVTDPHEVVPRYVRNMAKTAAEADALTWLKQQFGRPMAPGDARRISAGIGNISDIDGAVVPTDLLNMVSRNFGNSGGQLAPLVSRVVGESNPLSRLAVGGASLLDKASSVYKGNVLNSPRFYRNNVFDDSIRATAAGVGPRDWFQAFNDVRTRSPVFEAARDAGTELGHAPQIDMGGVMGTDPGAWERLAREAAGTPSAWDRVSAPFRWAQDLGPRFGRWWNDLSRMAVYRDAVARGASPAEAARRTAEVLFDYGDVTRPIAGRLTQAARFGLPFGNFLARSTAAVPRIAMQNPGAVRNVFRWFEQGRPENAPEAPRSFTERGVSYPQTEREQAVSGEWRRLFGGTGARQGFDQWWLPRTMFNEYGTPFSSLDRFAQEASPMGKLAIQAYTGRDPFTGDPMSLSMRPFPAEAQRLGAPASWTAADNEAPISRWAWPYLPVVGSQPAMLGLNRAAYELAGGAQDPSFPPALLGSSRFRSAFPADQQAMTLMNFAGFSPVVETWPGQRLFNNVYRPQMDAMTGRDVPGIGSRLKSRSRRMPTAR